MKPLIGITLNMSDGRFILNEPYIKAVEKNGGIPVGIFTSDSEIIEKMDGLLLTGGYDIAPKFFGETLHPLLGVVTEERDILEMALVEKCLQKKIPIFGICRGLQLLNVYFGGTLYQHVEASVNTPILHMQKENRKVTTHHVSVKKESTFYSIVKKDRISVNSMHHQAIKKLGKNLNAVAMADDGLIEAIEFQGDSFCMAVQWHPEELVVNGDLPSKRLFQAFIEATQKYFG